MSASMARRKVSSPAQEYPISRQGGKSLVALVTETEGKESMDMGGTETRA